MIDRRRRMIAFGVAIAWGAGACDARAHRAGSSYARPGDDPHDTDTLYTLLRRTLVDTNPRPAFQAYACALARLRTRMGDETTDRRLHALLDTVYATPADQRRRLEVSSALSNADFALNKEQCGADFDTGFNHPSEASGVRR